MLKSKSTHTQVNTSQFIFYYELIQIQIFESEDTKTEWQDGELHVYCRTLYSSTNSEKHPVICHPCVLQKHLGHAALTLS